MKKLNHFLIPHTWKTDLSSVFCTCPTPATFILCPLTSMSSTYYKYYSHFFLSMCFCYSSTHYFTYLKMFILFVFTCLYVCATCTNLMPVDVRRGCQIPWIWEPQVDSNNWTQVLCKGRQRVLCTAKASLQTLLSRL